MDFLEMHELYHHGIDGQKWGVQNGPPYPLPYNAHSVEEKRKNPKALLDNNEPKQSYRVERKIQKAQTKLINRTNKYYDKLDKKNDKNIRSAMIKANIKWKINNIVNENAIARKVREMLEDAVIDVEFAKSKKVADEKARQLENSAIMKMTLEELKAKMRG